MDDLPSLTQDRFGQILRIFQLPKMENFHFKSRLHVKLVTNDKEKSWQKSRTNDDV